MITPFRRYKVDVDWINPDTGSFMSCVQVINLFNVEDYCNVNNDEVGFKDLHARTCITLNNGMAYKIRVSFDSFDSIMTEFLDQNNLLDDRSMLKKKNKLSALEFSQMIYAGPHYFHMN